MACLSRNSGIRFYASANFIDFPGRKSQSMKLMMALENKKNCLIGLEGLIGVGKTLLAQHVGVHIEESNLFRYVIFTTVSDVPDFNKIRHDIAYELNFQLEGPEDKHAQVLWSRICDTKGRVLIILDDIWKKLELKDIGIPDTNCCVLLTTSNSEVYDDMRCQHIISLQTLDRKDGLDLFSKCVGTRFENSLSEVMDVVETVLNACGGIPAAIEAMAISLRSFEQRYWKNILRCLLKFQKLYGDDDDLWQKVCENLKLSYRKLETEAKLLLTLCCLFPRGYEIPIELLSKVGIGSGIFGEAKSSSVGLILARNKLLKSFMLLQTNEVCVKVHELLREVILSIQGKDVQVFVSSSDTLNSRLRFLSWNSNIGFPDHFDATELQVLLLWVKRGLKVEELYEALGKMVNLRVVLICRDKDVVHTNLSLGWLFSLKNIRTVILNGWKLEDTFRLKHLNNLVSLVFEDCSIMQLPEEIVVEKLRLLGIRRCRLEMKKAFEAIGSLSQLEELDFVQNDDLSSKPKDEKGNRYVLGHGKSYPALQKYCIAPSGLQYFVDGDNGLYKSLNTKYVKDLMPEEMLKNLMERAEILELSEMREARWKCLVPDMIPMKYGVLKDLMKLALYECPDIECVLDNSERIRDVYAFSKLVELHLDHVGAKDLWRGLLPSRFLGKLETFMLSHCEKLGNGFLKDILKLPHLKVLRLNDCPMFKGEIFGLSVARSLVLLEELWVENCKEVVTLIKYRSPRQEVKGANDDGHFFPKLKILKIEGCGKLRLVWSFLVAGDLGSLQELCIRSCEELEYLIGEYQEDEGRAVHKNINMLPSLTTVELEAVPSFIGVWEASTSPVLKTRARGWFRRPAGSSESWRRNEIDQRRSQKVWEITPVKWPSLRCVNLGRELVKSPFPHSMVYLRGKQLSSETGDLSTIRGLRDRLRGMRPNLETGVDLMELLKDMQNLTSLRIRHSEVEEAFNVEGIKSEVEMALKLRVLEVEGLPNMRRIYKDPKNILNLCHLEVLVISHCDKLWAIFSRSTMKCLQRLSDLKVTQCRDLNFIIEEDADGTDQLCLPMLQKVCISQCDSLRALFSISTSTTLQKLESLDIEAAPNMKEVFGLQQDDASTRDGGLLEVAPKLSHIKLKSLPNLARFCSWIDIQSVKQLDLDLEVVDCAILEKPEELEGEGSQERAYTFQYSSNYATLGHPNSYGRS